LCRCRILEHRPRAPPASPPPVFTTAPLTLLFSMENNITTTSSLSFLVMTLVGVRRVQLISQLSTWHLAEETLAVQPNISADKRSYTPPTPLLRLHSVPFHTFINHQPSTPLIFNLSVPPSFTRKLRKKESYIFRKYLQIYVCCELAYLLTVYFNNFFA
jgi:hypothetical protein